MRRWGERRASGWILGLLLASNCLLGALLASNCVGWRLRDRRELLEGSEPRTAPDGAAALERASHRSRAGIDQERFSLGRLEALGRVVDLADARFDRENGNKGLWRRLDFLFDVGPGIYFLEACDPAKIPVLFVHGITGSPREFETILAGLDRTRFEPWLYYYASGAPLAQVSGHLSQQVAKLARHCRARDLFVVAHSMGGLVARSFILNQQVGQARGNVTLFVSIATPWGGQAEARFAWLAPAGLDLPPSFRDVAPGSAFIEGLFFEDPDTRRVRRRLPSEVAYHLVYGFKRAESSTGPSADGIVQLSSAARLEAQEEAQSQRAFDYGHADILRSPELVAHLDAILSAAAR